MQVYVHARETRRAQAMRRAGYGPWDIKCEYITAIATPDPGHNA